jgi:hypothetical protein
MKAKCNGVFNPCKQAIKDAEAGRRARFEEHPYAFLFEGGRLVMIEVHARDFAAVVSEAPSKYGKPTKLEEETDRTATEVQAGKRSMGYARWRGYHCPRDRQSNQPRLIRATTLTVCSAEKQRALDHIFAQKPVL